MDVEQQNSPSFSPDGRKVVFSGNRNGRFDIFTFDLESGEVVNLTDDERYDGAPVYSPDGASVVYSSVVGGENAQLFRLELADPTRRYQLTSGDWSDSDAVFSSDGKWIVFTSDRTGNDNIWALELETGRTVQITNAVTGCMMPTTLKTEGEQDRIVYTGFWKGSFDLYVADLGKAIGEPTVAPVPTEPAVLESLPKFEPDIQVTLDEGNKSDYGGFKLFVEDGGGSVGVTDDQLFLGYGYLALSDYLGDRRLNIQLSAVDTFSDFDIQYIDARKRWQWSVRLFDNRDYYTFDDYSTLDFRPVERQEAYRQTGLIGTWIYPFDLYHRLEAGGGYLQRKYFYPLVNPDNPPVNGQPPGVENYLWLEFSDDIPLAIAAFTGDTTVNAYWGPVSGRRYRVLSSYGYDVDEGGALVLEHRGRLAPVLLDHPAQPARAARLRRLRRRQPAELLLPRRHGHAARPRLPLRAGRPRLRHQHRAALPADRRLHRPLLRLPGHPRAHLLRRRRRLVRFARPGVRSLELGREPFRGCLCRLRLGHHGALLRARSQLGFRQGVEDPGRRAGRGELPHLVLDRLAVLGAA